MAAAICRDRSIADSDSSEVTAAFMASPVSHWQMVAMINAKKLLLFFLSPCRPNLFVLRNETHDLRGLCVWFIKHEKWLFGCTLRKPFHFTG